MVQSFSEQVVQKVAKHELGAVAILDCMTFPIELMKKIKEKGGTDELFVSMMVSRREEFIEALADAALKKQ